MTIRMADLAWGVGSEARVLLVHGVSSSAQTWWRVASMLAAVGIESTAVDLRGHGNSPRTDSYALDDFTGDLEAHLARSGPFAVVVGHSLGGSVVASADVGDAARLLIDPVLDTPDPESIRVDLMDELDATPEQIEAMNPTWHPDDVHWKWRSASLVTKATMQRFLDQFLPADITGRLAALERRAVLLAADPLLGGLVTERAREIAVRNPSIDVVDLPGVGHSVQREDPMIVADAVRRLV